MEGERRIMEKSIFTYAWDILEEKPGKILPFLSDIGSNTICLASSYHSG